MKFLATLIILTCAFAGFCDDPEKKKDKPSSELGIITYSKSEKFDLTIYNDYITRYHSVALTLDSLIYWTEAKGDFYIHLEVDYFNWNHGTERPEPTYSFSKLFEQTVKKDKSFNLLKQQRLTAPLPLDKITTIQIKTSIVKKNDKQKAINNVLEKYLDQVIPSSPATELIKDLLSTQNDDANKIMVFNSDFDVPLNSLEYRTHIGKGKEDRLLKNNEPIYIPIDQKIQDGRLKPSVAQGAFNALSKVVGAVIGTDDFAKNKIDFRGMVKLDFTSDNNLNIPEEVAKGIDDISFSIGSGESWIQKYSRAKEDLVQTLETVRITDRTNFRLIYGVKNYIVLSEVYTAYLSNLDSLNSNLEYVQDFHNRFNAFYRTLELSENIHGFVSFAISDIYPDGKFAKIFAPYGMDEATMNLFISWQIRIHEYFAEQWQNKFEVSIM